MMFHCALRQRKSPIKRPRKRIRARGKFKAFGSNPIKKYKRKRTDEEVMEYARQCREERLCNRTRAEMAFAQILDELKIPYELEKIFLNGDRHILADVFIPSARIAFEIDGEELHARQRKYDDGRSRWLENTYGVKTVRIPNLGVLRRTAEVKELIVKTLFPLNFR